MSLAGTTVELEFDGVIAGVPFVVGIQTKGVPSEVVLRYGSLRIIATQGVDYTLAFAPGLMTFTITPTASLITKIAANGPNEVFAARTLPLTTDFDYDNAFVREKLVDEFDRLWMTAQQLDFTFGDLVSAEDSADAAAISEANAAASAAAALASQNAAATSEANALTSKNAAAASATAAATSATNSANSATAAAGSATTATTQAGNASTSATAAAGSATTASTQATNSANSATAASGSATAAATSATNAANSATAAATSATNAANSAASIGGKVDDYTLVASVAGSALTVALKNSAGADPSGGAPAYIRFRNATLATGDYTTLTLTAALSVVLSSGSTAGAANNVPFRLWVVAFNDAGTCRLGLVNCVNSALSIMALRNDQLRSSTAEGGAGAADSAHVIYTGVAVATKAMRILGYLDWTAGLAAAGTWGIVPVKIQLFGPGVSLPGDMIQEIVNSDGTPANGTTILPLDNTIPQSGEGVQFMTQAITPIGAANILEIIHNGVYAGSQTDATMGGAIFQDSTANAIAAVQAGRNGAADAATQLALITRMLAGVQTSTTFKVRAGFNNSGTIYFNGNSVSNKFNGLMASFLSIKEYMA